MPRPKHIDRPIEAKVNIPSSLFTQVQLQLYSDLEQRVPYGAFSRYVVELIKKDQERLQQGKEGVGA
ncbi:hypothetical protein [Bacteriophage sp.]|nr:hypothetical protein [Bacteriophage sp.]